MPNRNKRMNDAWNSMRANSDSPLNQTSSIDWVEDYKRQQRRKKTQSDSPLEQRLPHEKKIKLSSWDPDDISRPLTPGERQKAQFHHGMEFIKGARTKTGTYTREDVTAERGKKTYYDLEGKTYKKEVYRKAKGAKTGPDAWEFKRSKDISQEKYERQTKRKSKRYKGVDDEGNIL